MDMSLNSVKSGTLNFLKNLGFNKAGKITSGLYNHFEPIQDIEKDGKIFRFTCPNNLIRWRLDTFFTKEPGTIEWIDSIPEGDILFDIGANIGLYSIYAASKKVNTYSFEPESQNYAVLNKNIFLNGLHPNIKCFCLALSNEDKPTTLNLPQFVQGTACNQIQSSEAETKNIAFSQGIYSITLDDFVKQSGSLSPNHIKIDVDGVEPFILEGASETLSNPALKSILIEVDTDLSGHEKIESIITKFGFTVSSREETTLEEDGLNSQNIIFRR